MSWIPRISGTDNVGKLHLPVKAGKRVHNWPANQSVTTLLRSKNASLRMPKKSKNQLRKRISLLLSTSRLSGPEMGLTNGY